jgi:hypothetical protein
MVNTKLAALNAVAIAAAISVSKACFRGVREQRGPPAIVGENGDYQLQIFLNRCGDRATNPTDTAPAS